MSVGRRRAAIAKGFQWASRCTSIAIGMLIPGFVGYAIDERLGTRPVLLMLGFAFGFAYGLWRLVSLLATQNQQGETPQAVDSSDDGN